MALGIELRALSVLASAGLLALSCAGQAPAQGELQILKFSPSSKAVVNPGKGWVVYGASPKGRSKEALEVCSSAYERFSWAQLEPEEGKFNWAPVDDALSAWSAAGKQFGFGVMCENFHSSSKYDTPKWVFDAGAPAIEYDGWKLKGKLAPKQWDDPVFLAKLRNFIEAMGRRYDGDPRISLVDIRSYGQWGEGHLYHMEKSSRLPLEGLRTHFQIHLDAFKRTRLFIPWGEKLYDPVYDWAVGRGVGLRRDGVLWHSDASELIRCKGKVPSFGEWSCRDVKAKSSWKLAWGDDLEGRILADTARGAFSYQNLAQSDVSDVFVKEMRPFVDRLTNMMGYHFLLSEAVVPRRVASDSSFEASFRWENKGLAPIFIPCQVVAALIDGDGKVVATSPAKGCDPAKWAPGAEVSETASLKLAAPAGPYRLAVGLLSDPKSRNPDIRLGIEGELVDGWHVLGSIVVD